MQRGNALKWARAWCWSAGRCCTPPWRPAKRARHTPWTSRDMAMLGINRLDELSATAHLARAEAH